MSRPSLADALEFRRSPGLLEIVEKAPPSWHPDISTPRWISSWADSAIEQGAYMLEQAGHQPNLSGASWQTDRNFATREDILTVQVECSRCRSRVRMQRCPDGGVSFVEVCSERCGAS